jgi:hypothetical protein
MLNEIAGVSDCCWSLFAWFSEQSRGRFQNVCPGIRRSVTEVKIEQTLGLRATDSKQRKKEIVITGRPSILNHDAVALWRRLCRLCTPRALL